MSESIESQLFRARAEYRVKNQLFTYGRAALINDGFTLYRADPFGFDPEEFPVTSAGLLLMTLNPVGQACVLLVNEEEGRWAITSGKVEPEDNHPADAAKREFREETGV